jgi:hypothetical protein
MHWQDLIALSQVQWCSAERQAVSTDRITLKSRLSSS